ncbi:RNA polymerase sigma factor [Arenicella xantha]|uniref:RNA polymerase sigma-70 factor (ECF subfamily) n=1 Tax=Arenicella xantha TaxID=644221 RepID=A0A395JLG8_9GAMM|nr:sigma-70 family RNA polymerase sigma factor [Arenicella xantha]RBP51449.1 RNA polymerase sigma-70 factor (ECF subfamily) [Arenicella xantha]
MAETITTEFLKYRRVISSLLRKIRPRASLQDIEDILQDTYINTYQASLKQEINFPKAFMVKTALRLANRQIAVAQRADCDAAIDERSDETAPSFNANEFASQTEQLVMNREDFGFLCEAVSELPAQCRKVFILKKVYGLSQREIAEKLGISESTVEKHVAKGLLRTMQHYAAQQEHVPRNVATVKAFKSANGGRDGK